jgi:myosin heavy subunit
MLPKGNDESFVSKAKKSNSGSKKMISKKLHLPHEFAVEHFAGTVQYDAKSFVQTNMDKLPENLIRCASRSSNSLISDEFKKIITSCKVHGDGSKSSIRKKKVNNKTVLHKFQHQLKDLITTMEGTRTRYIRCIKANSPMIPKLTDHVSTMKQLECSGLMTALIISKESFPQKLTYDFILSRYACLLQNDRLKDAVAGMGAQEKVKYVLMRWLKPLSTKNRDGTRTMPFACGKTKVFFKPGAQDHLEYLRRQFYERSSLTIQSWFRRIAAKRHVVLRKQSMYKIQSFCRMALARLRIENQKKASTFICAWIRCRWALLAFQLKRDKATTIQSEVRRWREEKKYTKMRGSALLVQATIRMLLTRLQSQRLKDASGVINTWIYRCVFHMKLKRSLAAKMIQRHWRACRCQRNLRDSVSGALIIQKTWQAHVSRKKVLSEKHLQHDCTSRNLPMALGDDGSDFCSDDSDVVSSSYSTLNSMNATNFRSMKPDVASEKQHSEATYNGRLTDAEISGMMEKMKQSKVKEQLQLAEIEQLQVTFKRRVADLTKANNGLVKEVFKLRQECDKAKKQQRMDALQMNSKLEAIEEDKERLRRKYEKKIQSLERRLFENEEQHVEEKKAKDRDVRVLEAKYSDSVATLREELKKTQDSHQKYLAKLMTILETTQSMREKETAKITGELRAIKKEKDGQILMLQQELNAARAAKGIVVSSVAPKMMIDSPRMKKELLSDADRMVECSQKFNDAVEQLTNLITSSHVLPPVVGPHNMAEVLEQQENAQRMMELIGVLMDLYSIGEERQASTNEQALTAVNDYIALSEPDEAIRDLRERLAQVELENARIRQELREKEHCRKCAIREEAARRRIEWSGY